MTNNAGRTTGASLVGARIRDLDDVWASHKVIELTLDFDNNWHDVVGLNGTRAEVGEQLMRIGRLMRDGIGLEGK